LFAEIWQNHHAGTSPSESPFGGPASTGIEMPPRIRMAALQREAGTAADKPVYLTLPLEFDMADCSI
jgi:hypothetical protein